MAEVGFILISDEVAGNPEVNQLAIINPYPELHLESIPWPHTFSVSLSIYDILPEKKVSSRYKNVESR